MILKHVRFILALVLLACGLPTLALADDIPADAGNLDLGSTLSDSIDPAGDVDWLRIEVPQSGTLYVWTTGYTDTIGTLYDANGNFLTRGDDMGFAAGAFNFQINHDVDFPGTYYLVVEGYTDPSFGIFTTGAYTLHAEFIADSPVDCSTSNDTLECADDFPLNSTLSDSIYPADDVDWLRIEVPESGTLRIWTTGDTDTIAILADANGNVLAFDDDSGTSLNFEIVHNVSPGTYYLVIEGFHAGPYDLHSAFTQGDTGGPVDCSTTNDTLECADDFPLNSTLSDSINPAGDVDWLRIEVPAYGTLQVWTTGDTDTFGALYDADGNFLAENDDIDFDAGDYNFEIIYDVSPGTYYLKVEGFTAPDFGIFETGPYDLHSRFDGRPTITEGNQDVNEDGDINIEDLISVAFNYGKTVAGGADPNADVNNDGRVDILDLTAVAEAIDPSYAAPDAIRNTPELPFTTAQVQQWIVEAGIMGADAKTMALLRQLLTALTEATPEDTVLLANYPNPFNPETWIPYQLANDAEVRLTIYNIQGLAVRELNLGHQIEGFYTSRDRAAYWDGKDAFGESVASGVYFYTLTAGDFTATRKMLIRK